MLSKQKKFVLILVPVWIFIFFYLEKASGFVVYNLLGFDRLSAFTEALRFFIYEVPKVLMLLIMIVFIVGFIRTYFSPEKTRKALEGKSLFAGNIMASTLGIVTPFCSCSAVPLFIGFIKSGIPLGVTISYLIAAPMINEVAVVLLIAMFGWKTALIYVATGMFIAVLSGWIIGKLKLEKWVEDWVYQVDFADADVNDEKQNLDSRIDAAIKTVKDIVFKVAIYIVLGVAVGAGIHGYVPEDFMASFMGENVWYSVPLAVLLGVPMYSNAAGIFPVVQALLEKGASLGTSLAFMMSVIGLSLPEIIILKKVLKFPLIISFVCIVATGIIIIGYLFNLIF